MQDLNLMEFPSELVLAHIAITKNLPEPLSNLPEPPENLPEPAKNLPLQEEVQ